MLVGIGLVVIDLVLMLVGIGLGSDVCGNTNRPGSDGGGNRPSSDRPSSDVDLNRPRL